MLFNSISFFLFFPIVTTTYFWLPHRFRNYLLLAASCFFYMWAIPRYIFILVYLITVDYVAGIKIENSFGPSRKKWMILSLVANIGVLFFFKFFSVFSKAAHLLNLDSSHIFWSGILLPIGLSFHTFQAMSYTIEVYRGTQKAERNFVIYALYVMFYPQLVAGPIERPKNLIHQFHEEHHFQYEDVVKGLRLMLWGMFKKVAVADLLAVVVNQVYQNVQAYSGVVLIIATVFFAFQIFYDFSGYSDIAIGAAQVMGFKLMMNFNNPYVSTSFSEFWKRWHISLSSWFRDYVYIPLGGNRVPSDRHYGNILLTFLLSGLWHGFNFTFAIWGYLNGLYVVFSILTKTMREKMAVAIGLDRMPIVRHYLSMICVFSLTCFAWIFFRANNLSDALYVITHLLGSGSKWDGNPFSSVSVSDLGWNSYFWLVLIFLIIFTQCVQSVQKTNHLGEVIALKPMWVRWGFYYLLGFAIALAWMFSVPGPKQFLYFQF